MMNLYEVRISGTLQQIQASKPEVALKGQEPILELMG